MNGELANVIALALHGSAWLLDGNAVPPDLERVNSTFQYVRRTEFDPPPGLERGDPDDEVLVAWQCYQQVRAAYAAATPATGTGTGTGTGKTIAEHIVTTYTSCPIPEIARLGRTLRQWKDTYLGYFTTGGANNGGTEAVCECGTWLVWDWLVRMGLVVPVRA